MFDYAHTLAERRGYASIRLDAARQLSDKYRSCGFQAVGSYTQSGRLFTVMERQVSEKTIKYIHPSYPLTEEETEVIRQCQYIRRKVFIEGQNVDEHIELDGKDQQFDHLLLYYGGTPAGCLRINTSSNSRVKLERLAVLHAYRNLGLGTSLLHKAIALCLEQGNENISSCMLNIISWITTVDLASLLSVVLSLKLRSST